MADGPWTLYQSGGSGSAPSGSDDTPPWKDYPAAKPDKPPPAPPVAPVPPKKPLVSELVDSFADVPREIGHEFMEGGRAYSAAARAPYDKHEDAPVSPILPSVTPRGLKELAGVSEQAGAPITGLFTSVIGRPLETVTGGRLKKQAIGNAASMAVPVLGEISDELALTKLMSEFGLNRTAAKALLAKAPQAATKANGALADNVRALQALKIQPSLAVASTKRGTRAATQALGQNVFLGPLVRKAINRTSTGFRSALDEAVGPHAPSASSAGESVKSGLERFSNTTPVVRQAIATMSPKTRMLASSAARAVPSRTIGFGTKAENLYGRAEDMIGPSGQPIPLHNTQAALNDVMHSFDNPALRGLFENSKLRAISDALQKDNGRMTWNDATQLRTKIRETLKADPALRHTVSDAQVNDIYSALTKDLQEGAGKLGGSKAKRSYEQANQFYRTGMDRINNTLSKYYKPDASGESVFYSLMQSAQEGGRSDLKRLNQVRHSLSPEEWHEVQSGVIDQMGRSLPGQRTPETDFSFSTFLTNFNKMDTRGAREESGSDSGLKALFGGRENTVPQLRRMAKVAGEMRELDKLKNNSMSGAMAGNLLTGGLFLTQAPSHPLAAIGSLLVGNVASKALESPTFVRWLSGVPEGDVGGSSLYDSMNELAKLARKDHELSDIYHQLRAGLVPVGAINSENANKEQ